MSCLKNRDKNLHVAEENVDRGRSKTRRILKLWEKGILTKNWWKIMQYNDRAPVKVEESQKREKIDGF
jgi:hypothetical protein